ncbi:MAG: insulinase family protein [Clostridia bacterium]|nr:insulinase family protein [Clostridia bacterium]
MTNQTIELKQGIKFHKIETNKFKTNLFAVFFSLPLTRQTVTKNALLAAILRRGTANMKTQEKISKNLEEMYGASFDCGIEKTGDSHTIKFYLESINDEFLPQKEDLLKRSLEILLDIAFNPLTENGKFKEEYVEQEKENLKQIIEGKIDNKGAYALERCIEEMYKNKAYGLYKYGYIEDLNEITSQDLYNYYKQVINECKIDIFASGILPQNTEELVKENENIIKLQERNIQIKDEEKELPEKENIVEESMDITQGKLVIGLDVTSNIQNLSYITMCYNTILGGGANSKMFQNVREKASLAYTVGSNFLKRKHNIMIRAGIEIENYEKALEIIKEQLKDMQEGNFTDEDIENAKNLIIATIENIPEEQDTEISYYLGQELAGTNISVEEYKEKIQNVTKEQIVEVAKSVKMNTVYFLKN